MNLTPPQKKEREVEGDYLYFPRDGTEINPRPIFKERESNPILVLDQKKLTNRKILLSVRQNCPQYLNPKDLTVIQMPAPGEYERIIAQLAAMRQKHTQKNLNDN